jgi:hypothetical protein
VSIRWSRSTGRRASGLYPSVVKWISERGARLARRDD